MGATIMKLASLWALSILTAGGVAQAAAPDLRLVDAAARHDAQAVRTLLQEGVDVNAPRADGVTALLWAAHWDAVEMVELLLQAGADPNADDDHGVTPLMRACENASLAVVERLLAAGANADATQTSGLTPSMIAARTGSVRVVKALLAHGANVNAATAETDVTALMWAVSAPHPDIVQVLIDSGADVRVSSRKGVTPLMTAARSGDIAMAETLITAGADVNDLGSDGTHPLPFAIIQGQNEFALFLLEQGADPNGTIDGVPALHAAAGNVNTWLVNWARRHGSGRGIGSSRRRTVVLEIDPDRRVSVVKALLDRGADPNGRITTSAMIMSYIGYPKKGAFEPFACGTGDLRGATPLWVAAFNANSRTVNIRGRDRTAGPSRADSSAEILRTLLAAGADQQLTTDDGTTPFMVAAGLGRSTYTPRVPRGIRSPNAEEAVRVLFEAGAQINATNEADYAALHGATFRGLNEVVEYLVAHGADINARDFRGRTPFRLAEGSKQSFQFQSFPETAELLRKLGADTRLGVPGTVQERADREVATASQP